MWRVADVFDVVCRLQSQAKFSLERAREALDWVEAVLECQLPLPKPDEGLRDQLDFSHILRDGIVLCESVALSSSSLLFFSDHRVLFSFCFYGQSGSVFFWPTISFRHFFVDIFDKPCHLESNQQSSPVRVDSTRTFFVAVPFCCCCSLRRFHSDARQGTRGDFSISIGIVPLSLSRRRISMEQRLPLIRHWRRPLFLSAPLLLRVLHFIFLASAGRFHCDTSQGRYGAKQKSTA